MYICEWMNVCVCVCITLCHWIYASYLFVEFWSIYISNIHNGIRQCNNNTIWPPLNISKFGLMKQLQDENQYINSRHNKNKKQQTYVYTGLSDSCCSIHLSIINVIWYGMPIFVGFMYVHTCVHILGWMSENICNLWFYIRFYWSL